MFKWIYLIRNKEIVGKCKLQKINKTELWLENVLIYKQFRGLGYSTFLVRKAINVAKKMKIKKIFLHVKYDNYAAIKSYKNNGFKITRKNYDKNKLFGYTMTLDISL